MQSLKELYKIGRGPSSSHTMGPERAARDFFACYSSAARYRVVLYGSLARTGRGHLTDRAILSVLPPEKTEILFDSSERELPHPNTLVFSAADGEGNLLGEKTYLSVGGGTVCAEGDFPEEEKETYPFENFAQMRAYCKAENLSLGDLAFRFEGEEMMEYLLEVWRAMQTTAQRGLKREGLLPGELKVERKAAMLYRAVRDGGEDGKDDMRLICAYAYATAEENASGGTVVTAPTCGASGVLPAVLLFLTKKHALSDEQAVKALAAAGAIGNVVKKNACVSGAEAGCQAEIGTATAMAAAAVCSVYGYSLEETEYAAEIALEHQLGLTCDPIGGYVQIPCIERNAVAARRALDSADLAHVLAGTRKISFDLIVKTMYETGKDLNARYRETSEGGLAAGYKVC